METFQFGKLTVPSIVWEGFLFWKCPFEKCGHTFQGPDTLQIRLHIRHKHIDALLEQQEQALKPQATLYDGDGKLITRMPAPANAATPEMVEALLSGELSQEISEDFHFQHEENE